jgi:hemoglobin/transferrin/lactoferrin receptor protein
MTLLAPWRARLLGALLALPAGLPYAQEEPAADLHTITVTGSRRADPEHGQTARTSRITARDLTDRQARSIKDAVREEPGVSVTQKPSRFGTSGYNIRGLEDNRILMLVDGVRMPDAFVMGGYSSATRDMVDIELLQAIEIQRGTGSAKSGSDALGGVVSYATPRPEDILRGRQAAASLKTLYQSVDRSRVGVMTAAAGDEQVKFLIRGVRRLGHESKTQGRVGGTGIRRTVANPQQVDGEAALLKLALTPLDAYRAEIGLQTSRRDVATHVLSGIVGGLARDMNTDDRYRHGLLSLDQQLRTARLGTLDLKLYRQRSSTWQYTRQDRNPTNSAFSEVLYQRYFDFVQETRGAKLDGLTALGDTHVLSWGAEASLTETTQLRDGSTTLRNGTVSRAVTVDQFPTRDMPPSDTRRQALYVQDEWQAAQALTVTTAARYERYRLTPKPDAIYLANEAAAPAAKAGFDNVSPKLGAIWRLGGGYVLAGQYAHGFRAPPYDDVNIGFANLTAGYTAVANPALKEETSRGVELALRHSDEAGSWSITAFDNRYRDFIDNVQLACPADPACSPLVPLTFQSRNIPKVRIHGLEARLVREVLPGWTLRGGLAYAKGRNSLTGQPIYSINPTSGNLGLTHARGPLRLDLLATFAEGKRAEDAEGSSRQFLPAGYAVLDLRLTWTFAKNSQLTLGAYNLFDRTYYHWADIPVADIHVPDSQAGPQRYSQPGRNFAVTFVYSL